MTRLPILPFEIVTGDALEHLATLQDGSIDLIVSSPPYNIGKAYERGVFPSLVEYTAWMANLLAVLERKLSLTGSVCWQVGNHVKDSAVTPLDSVFFPIFTDLGFKLRNRVIWTFNFGLHAKRRLSGRYETLLWFTKSDEFRFNLDPIRVPQLYPGKRHSAGKKRQGPSGNPLGKNPSDFWEFSGPRFFDEETIWSLPNIKANHPEKEGHPCQFPSELVERCVLAFTDANDLVIDPFSGTGTVPIVANALGRRGLGVELNAEYAEASRLRFDDLEKGRKTLRKSGQVVRKPSLSEKVARVPEEWFDCAAE